MIKKQDSDQKLTGYPIAALGLVTWIFTSAIAASASEMKEQAVQALTGFLSCPIPLRAIPDPFTNEENDNWVEKRRVTNKGDGSKFWISVDKQRIDKTGSSNTMSKTSVVEDLSASYSDLSRANPHDEFVTLDCKGGQKCIRDTQEYDDGDDVFGNKKFRLAEATIRFCDKDSADSAAQVIDILIGAPGE